MAHSQLKAEATPTLLTLLTPLTPLMSTPEDDFKAAVKAYIDIHDKLAQAGRELREVRKKKTELADVIVQYMKRNDIDECALQDGNYPDASR